MELTKSDSVEVLARNLVDVGFKYTWKIPDYLKGVDGEIDVDSPTFRINVNGLDTRWSLALRYWTNEEGLRLTNPVVICLNLVSASSELPSVKNGNSVEATVEQVQVRYQFGIWDNDVKQFEVCPVAIAPLEVKNPPPQEHCLQSVGTRDIMILDRHLVGKSIEIFCKIMLIRNQELEEQHTLVVDLWTKCKAGVDCDVKIRTNDGNMVPAHKTILTCRSPTIKSMIDSEGIIKLDLGTPLLTSLLQYIYTDRVEPLENPQNLLKFAVKLDLPGLKGICERALIDQIAPSTVASLLLIADTFHCDLLKKTALTYCGENPNSIVKTVAWKVMEQINPKLFEEVCEQL